jgi:predicted TIM-barrel fold metal-dependent hydrolase
MIRSAPTDARFNFVDSHLHLWDLANGWYPLLEPTAGVENGGPDPAADLGMGDMSAIKRNYLYDDYDDYVADSADYAVDQFVHVHATMVPGANLDETRWLAGLAKSVGPRMRIDGQVSGAQGGAEILHELEQHAAITELFVGARVVEGIDYESTAGRDFMRALAANGWIYDAVAHPGGGIRRLAKAVASNEQLSVVIEHAGWPLARDGTFDIWRSEMAELAARPNVSCKLSGFAMWLHRVDAPDLQPWLESCVELFGPDRCIVGSNFPVDSLWADFGTLLGAYRSLTSQYGAAAQRAMFETNARRMYRF